MNYIFWVRWSGDIFYWVYSKNKNYFLYVHLLEPLTIDLVLTFYWSIIIFFLTFTTVYRLCITCFLLKNISNYKPNVISRPFIIIIQHVIQFNSFRKIILVSSSAWCTVVNSTICLLKYLGSSLCITEKNRLLHITALRVESISLSSLLIWTCIRSRRLTLRMSSPVPTLVNVLAHVGLPLGSRTQVPGPVGS